MKRFLLVLFALLGVRLVLMCATPVFDPSEARYAALSANMARTGDFIVPHFTYEGKFQSFDGKPPLVFQAGGLFCRVFGVNEFAVRLFPLLSAILLLAILRHAVRRQSDAETANLAVLVCATSTAFFAAAGLAMTDMTLTCCVAGALLLYRCFILEEERRGRAAWAYAAGTMALLGAGMIVKGPVALVLFGLPAFADAIVNRRWTCVFNVKWLATLPVFLVVAVPWFVLVEARNPGSVWYFFYNENFLRFFVHDYGDKYGAGREKFRGVALLWAWIATLPWSFLPLLKLRKGLRLPTRAQALAAVKSVDWRSFELIGLLAITAFWCLTSRVLLYYLFPMIPLFAAWLALKGDLRRIEKLVPRMAGFTTLAAVCACAGGMLFSGKMRGAEAPETYGFDGYSREFYHGTNPRCLTKGGVSVDDWLRERWFASPEGQRWLATPEGQSWLKKPHVQAWLKEWSK